METRTFLIFVLFLVHTAASLQMTDYNRTNYPNFVHKTRGSDQSNFQTRRPSSDVKFWESEQSGLKSNGNFSSWFQYLIAPRVPIVSKNSLVLMPRGSKTDSKFGPKKFFNLAKSSDNAVKKIGLDPDPSKIVQTTLALLEEGKSKIQLSTQTDIVLVVGTTGSGKSTLVQLLTGDNSRMWSIKKRNTFIIIDEAQKIGNQTTKSLTEFPELFIHNSTGSAFYDCPGFQDTRNLSVEISNSFFIKQVADHGHRVKIVVLVNRFSLLPYADRNDFKNLLKQLSILVKNPSKFRKAFTLIVSKVTDPDPDSQVIEDIAGTLADIKEEMRQDGQPLEYGQLIDAFLDNGAKNYSKIGLFRAPTVEGCLSEIEAVQRNRRELLQVILEDTTYVQKSKKGFGYALSPETKLIVRDLVSVIGQNAFQNVEILSQNLAKVLIRWLDNLMDFHGSINFVQSNLIKLQKMKTFTFSPLDLLMPSRAVQKLMSQLQQFDLSSFPRNETEKELMTNLTNEGTYLDFLAQTMPTKDQENFLADMKKWTLPLHHLAENVSNYLVTNFAEKVELQLLSSMKNLTKQGRANVVMEFGIVKMDTSKFEQDAREKLGRVEKISNFIQNEFVQVNRTGQTQAHFARNVLTEIVKSLDFCQFNPNLVQSVTQQIAYLELVDLVDPSAGSKKKMDWSLPDWLNLVESLTKLLTNEKRWWNFINHLLVDLSSFPVQVGHQGDLKNWARGPGQEVKFSEENFSQFWKIFGSTPSVQARDFESINNTVGVNSDLKCASLNKLLDMTLRSVTQIDTTDGKELVKITGNFVAVSEILPHLPNSTQNLVFMVLNTIFLDADIISGSVNPLKNLNIFIVAPHWYIVGEERQFDLNGRAGPDPVPLKNDRGQGNPGAPGQNAGNFYGIAGTLEGGSLNISAIGGIGGRGQAGANGLPGQNGEDVDITKLECDENSQLLYVKPNLGPTPYGSSRIKSGCEWYWFFGTITWVCQLWRVYGQPGGQGHSGQNGGKGGLRGNGGFLGISLLNKKTDSPILNFKTDLGSMGNEGRGGDGGLGGQNGRNRYVKVKSNSYLGTDDVSHVGCWVIGFDWSQSGQGPSGSPGKAGGNSQNGTEPDPQVYKNSSTLVHLNSFKVMTRNEIRRNKFFTTFLSEFLNQIEMDQNVNLLYTPIDLYDDLRKLLKQFSTFSQENNSTQNLKTGSSTTDHFREKGQTPYLESLMHRIHQKVMATSANDLDSRAFLAYLYTVALGRVTGLKSSTDPFLITDIKGYFQILDESVKNLKEKRDNLYRFEVTEKRRKEFQADLSSKMDEAHYFISEVMGPEILAIENRIEDDIDKLLDELTQLKNQTEQNLDLIQRKEQKLQGHSLIRSFLGIFKIGGLVLSFLGPAGMTAGALINGGLGLAESFLSPDHEMVLPDIPDSIRRLQNSVSDHVTQFADDEAVAFQIQLGGIYKFFNNQSNLLDNHTVADLLLQIDQCQGQVAKEIEGRKGRKAEPPLYPDTLSVLMASVRSVMDKKVVLKNSLNLYHQALQDKIKKGGGDEKEIKKFEKATKKVGSIVKILDLAATTYQKYQDDHNKLTLLTQQEAELRQELAEIDKQKQNVITSLEPMVQGMRNTLVDFEKNLGGKSGVALQVAKWRVTDVLHEIHKIIHDRFTQGLKIDQDFQECFQKLNDAFVTLINIYDRLNGYGDQAKMAQFLTAMVQAGLDDDSGVSNPELKVAIKNLDIILQESMVVERFGVAMRSFAMYVFPFADIYLNELKVPQEFFGLTTQSLAQLAQNSSTYIENLLQKIKSYETGVDEMDKILVKGEFTSRDLPPGSGSFFVWKFPKFGQKISKLLRGEKVIFRSDVGLTPRSMGAIKFTKIELGFRIQGNEGAENDFRDQLELFSVSLNHSGISNYRFKGHQYVMTSPEISLWYELAKNESRFPNKFNGDYEKLLRGDIMLSPYTMWDIQILPLINMETGRPLADFSKLTTFAQTYGVDLELNGYGSYVKEDSLGGGKIEKQPSDKLVTFVYQEFRKTPNYFE